MNAFSMPFASPLSRSRRTWAAGLALWGLGAAAHATDCQLACKGGPCAVSCADSPCLFSPGGAAVTLNKDLLQPVRGCEFLKNGDQSALELRYRHKGRWFSPPGGVDNGKALRELFAQFPPDPCGVPSPDCLQKRMAGMVASIGGHGIDDKPSQPGGEGDPCSLGLPCGAVVPPTDAWRFRLVDATLAGTWTVRLARGTPPPGQPAEMSVRIDKGLVAAKGAWFMPGAQYVYRFADAAGRRNASGEFSVISRTTADALHTLTQRRVSQGLSQGVAWSDTLGANNLEWDAHQLLLAPGETRR